ncbi:hypothetical protein RvY_17784 [Ramazzottius varieornatus]|uniref:Aminotransferase class V domain-containing protein n=1 Tax=Ramazzottius varieornatus TaxID=947166 RepID=A0A1D1W406_RAMVA|nr:hypothetical protein RvY_17784 [Ramazzottius varieornatus]
MAPTKVQTPEGRRTNGLEASREFGHRHLYDLPKQLAQPSSDPPATGGTPLKKEALLPYISRSIIGKDLAFTSPFGTRNVLYCDYTASGKSLSFIEDYIRNEVLPHYGSTHTTTTVSSLQTTMFKDEARSIIRNSVNASESDAVLFCGSGSTGAMHKLIRGLHLTEPPVVFIGPYEHHSVILPWREAQSDIVTISEDNLGQIDRHILKEELTRRRTSGRRLIGCFSAASNVTGILTDTDSITMLLHQHGALAIWDFSASAPYEAINMNPFVSSDQSRLTHKDAIVFSVHKFMGGVSTPGILVAKKKLFVNPVPDQHGGGTVFFVNSNTHRYLKEIENREEGGTPAIVEAIRAGLVFRLKDAVTTEVIKQRDDHIVRLVLQELRDVPNLILLGNFDSPRLAIFSFVIRHEASNRLLHHNYVSALLNDLFGIQSRAGCACAGPYAQHLLGIGLALAQEIEEVLMEDPRLQMHRWEVEFSQREVLRPGFVRVNFPYFFTDDEVKFVCEGIKMVASHGWRLLPQYQLNPETAEWRHLDQTTFQDRKWLSSTTFTSSGLRYPKLATREAAPKDFAAVLLEADKVFRNAEKAGHRYKIADQEVIFDERAANLRWFLLASEARNILLGIGNVQKADKMPFEPRRYSSVENKENVVVEKGKMNGREEPEVKAENGCGPCGGSSNNCCLVRRQPVDPAEEENRRNESVAKRSAGRKTIWRNPPKEIWKPMLTAIHEFEMIKNGDRVLVCLSGGKDSLSLLHAMRQYQFYAKSIGISIDLGAVTVDPGATSFDPRPLKPYLKSLGMPYFYEEQGIMDHAMTVEELNSICSFCSRMKRGRLYACARRNGYNVLAFGQHLDDLAESFLMSVFHNGRLRTMKASYSVVEEDLRVIRPLVYVREKYTRLFAQTKHLPVISENCPACFNAPKERFRVKQLLTAQELLYPGLYDSLRVALKPLMAIRTAGAENGIEKVPAILDQLYRAGLKNETVEQNGTTENSSDDLDM